MRTKVITVGRALLGFILALLGFSGCEDPDPTIGPDAYGPLYADYLYLGSETDTQTKQPDENIIAPNGYECETDSLYTDEFGKAKMTSFSGPSLDVEQPK